MDCNGSSKIPKPKSKEEIMAKLQALRAEQRRLADKIAEIGADHKEHQLVIDALKQMDGGRKVFRLMGGVLTERTVAAVLPELQDAMEKLPVLGAALEAQQRATGAELAAHTAEHRLPPSRDYPPATEPAPPPQPAVLV